MSIMVHFGLKKIYEFNVLIKASSKNSKQLCFQHIQGEAIPQTNTPGSFS